MPPLVQYQLPVEQPAPSHSRIPRAPPPESLHRLVYPPVSRLSNLLQVKTLDVQVDADLKLEMGALSGLRAFGMNFERHIPEVRAPVEK